MCNIIHYIQQTAKYGILYACGFYTFVKDKIESQTKVVTELISSSLYTDY